MKTLEMFAFFLEALPFNEVQVFIIECVQLVNEGRFLLVIECDGCGF